MAVACAREQAAQPPAASLPGVDKEILQRALRDAAEARAQVGHMLDWVGWLVVS